MNEPSGLSLDLAELQDLGLAIGLEQQRGVGAVQHRLLGRALQPLGTGGHEHGERVRLVGGEGRAWAAERVVARQLLPLDARRLEQPVDEVGLR